MERKEQLLKLLENNPNKNALEPMLDDLVFLEVRLNELKKLPFIKVHPEHPEMQKATPAGKQYKELLQQYNNCLKILLRATNSTDEQADSPLRVWVKSQFEK
jgi:hypothetical protein